MSFMKIYIFRKIPCNLPKRRSYLKRCKSSCMFVFPRLLFETVFFMFCYTYFLWYLLLRLNRMLFLTQFILIFDREYSFMKRKPALNLGIWMPADYHMPPPGVDMVGRFSTGRFGWFIPKSLIGDGGSSSVIPYTVFKDTNSLQYQRFVYDENVLRQL